MNIKNEIGVGLHLYNITRYGHILKIKKNSPCRQKEKKKISYA